MEPLYFYIVQIGAGQWEVRTHEAKPVGPEQRFASSDAALEFASDLALQAWNHTRSRAGIRVLDALGYWRDERVFGFDAMQSSCRRTPFPH